MSGFADQISDDPMVFPLLEVFQGRLLRPAAPTQQHENRPVAATFEALEVERLEQGSALSYG